MSFTQGNKSRYGREAINYKKVGLIKLSIGESYKEIIIQKGSENIYVDIVVYDETNEKFVLKLYTKENHNGLKLIQSDIVSKFKKGGTLKSIDEETPILPYVVANDPAETIARKLFGKEFENWDKLSAEAKKALDEKHKSKVDEISDYLVSRAESLYKHNERFRKQIKSAKGLPTLRMFMNHWCGLDGDTITGNIDTTMARWYKNKKEHESK